MQLTADRAQTRPTTPFARFIRPAQRQQWAGRVSLVFSPPVAGAAGLVVIAARIDTPITWLWALTDIALVVALPLLFVVWLVQTGRVSSIDLPQRHERARPYCVAILSAILAAGLSFAFDAPRALTVLLGALAIQTLILSVVTTWWKISLHTAAMAGAAAIGWHVAGPATLVIAALIPLVAWARIALGRHTLAQTIAGTLVGGVIYTGALLFMPAV